MPVLSSFSQLPASAVSAAGIVVSSSTPSSATATAPKSKKLVRRPARDKTAAAVPASVHAPAPVSAATKLRKLLRRPARDAAPVPAPARTPAATPAAPPAHSPSDLEAPKRVHWRVPDDAAEPAPTPAAAVQAATSPTSSLAPAKSLRSARTGAFAEPAVCSQDPIRAPRGSNADKAAAQATLAAARQNLQEQLRARSKRPARKVSLRRQAMANNIASELVAAGCRNVALQERLRSQTEVQALRSQAEVQALRDELAAERRRNISLQRENEKLKAAMAAAASSTAVETAPTRTVAKAPVVPSPVSARAALARRLRRLVQAVGAARKVPALGVEARPSRSGSEHSLAETLVGADAGCSAAEPKTALPVTEIAARSPHQSL
ncbi:hypothetical protein IWQ57_002896 [Coemansia nantahalensis]|uniref:Uncharacterized protein n=1 Tax=Coemansia nantahalensis TaxID=2789366 RepID=A0ACC1JYX9_9FUNG|nr:hypothetical protein IWQ57_002896 [Coemansia nantahalensis]